MLLIAVLGSLLPRSQAALARTVSRADRSYAITSMNMKTCERDNGHDILPSLALEGHLENMRCLGRVFSSFPAPKEYLVSIG